jgi:hypothetical protein
VVDTGYNSAGNGGHGAFIGDELHAPVAIFNPLDAVRGGIHAKADANMAAGGTISALHSGSDPDNGSLDSIMIQSGANQAGNGGDGYFYGGIVHASFVVYQPINIAVAVGYGASADAEQTNNVSIDQSAVQIAGVGGNGGIGNTASGGNVSGSSSGAGMIATGGSSAGDGGDGYFLGSLLNAPVVIYHPINIAMAGAGGTAAATQSNTLEIDQSAIQIAGVGGNGGNGNAASGGDLSISGHASGSGNGGTDPQMIGTGSVLSGLGSGSDAIATGANAAGNGGSGHFSGSITDVSVAIYAPINIAIARPNSTADADQVNDVTFDQSVVHIAGIGGHGGHGNLALGGDVAMHILSDLHLIG